ncbi:MAG: hypothetical protein ACREO5_07830 [Candidatus Binatia bacterium]
MVDTCFRHSGVIVTPVKTGVHPHPLNLDTVFQRYDGRCPSPGYRPEFILSASKGGMTNFHFA